MPNFQRTKGAMDIGVALDRTVNTMDQATGAFARASSLIDQSLEELKAAIKVMNDNPGAFTTAHKNHMRQFHDVDVPNFITELHQAVTDKYNTIPAPPA